MILTVLKTIVMVVAIIISALIEGTRLILRVLADAGSQAKAATPGTITALKEQAGIASVTGSSLASKGVADLRKVFKLPEKEEEKAKVSAN